MVHGVSKTKESETITVIYPLTAKGTLKPGGDQDF